MSGLGRFAVTKDDKVFIGIVLEGFYYGLYSAVFIIYMQYHASKKLGINKRNFFVYALCILYMLSGATIALDVTRHVVGRHRTTFLVQGLRLYYVSWTIIGLCDFFSQAILIYRCWVVWGRNIRLIIIPSILVFAYLATWLAVHGSIYTVKPTTIKAGLFNIDHSGEILTMTSLAISLTMNAVVTGLIVFRIVKVYWEARPTSEDRDLGVGGANGKLRSIIFIVIESGMAMFSVQLVRVVLNALQLDALYLVVGINQMFNGLTPTIIFVRVSMGLSFYNEASMVETVGSLRFASNNGNLEHRDLEIAGQERLDSTDIRQSDDIDEHI